MKTIETSHLIFSFLGPDLSVSCKTVLYFSLSREDSLHAKPFCHPAEMLAHAGFRVLSATLPFHEKNERPDNIKSLWGAHTDVIREYLDTLEISLIELGHLISEPIGVMGLSRGAFIASHLAATLPQITTLLGFAPLCHLEGDENLDLFHLAPRLTKKKIRFYIGHKDTLVKTELALSSCAHFIDAAKKDKIDPPSIDCVVKPSVGREGHGTLDTTFKEGVLWMKENL
jgi:predicted esterase